MRVILATDELLGHTRTGGIGTATTFLALGLGRLGHHVQLLYTAEPPDEPLAVEWARLYDEAGVGIRILSGPVDRPWGHRTLHLLDPDGFVVELAQEIPRPGT